jgi:hypothetical protein
MKKRGNDRNKGTRNMSHVFGQFFSLDSTKAIKARKYGYLNAINYMAPHTMAGDGNVCGDASAGCIALCLGWFSGHVSRVKKGQGKRPSNAVRKSRITKVKMFMHERAAFMKEMVAGILRAARKAIREGLKLCVRPNGSSDIPWESIKVSREMPISVFELFPDVQFVDYTKSLKRALKHARGEMPANYHLTFSRSETNEADCVRVLEAGGNVAVVAAYDAPDTYLGYRVIDGDKHDLRFLDALDEDGSGRGACVVWLSPKGVKARRDTSGFVVRL